VSPPTEFDASDVRVETAGELEDRGGEYYEAITSQNCRLLPRHNSNWNEFYDWPEAVAGTHRRPCTPFRVTRR